jgi:hypothetical protein
VTRDLGLVTRLTLFALACASAAGAQAAAPSTDVYVYHLGRPADRVINITNRAGYDNQPGYIGARLAWTQQSDGQTDIHWLNLETPKPFTQTRESEYSAALTPDGKNIAVIRVEMDSVQRLWQFPIAGGAPSVVLADIKPVGYFAYLDATTLALFVLGNPRPNQTPSTLQIADTRTGKGVVVTTNPGRSIQRVPGGRLASFTQSAAGKTTLMTVDPTPRADGAFAIDTVAVLPDSADYVVWRDAKTAITGAGSRLMQLKRPSKDWTVLADLSAQGIRRISRLALSPDGQRIAFVADEPKP